MEEHQIDRKRKRRWPRTKLGVRKGKNLGTWVQNFDLSEIAVVRMVEKIKEISAGGGVFSLHTLQKRF